MGFDNGGNGDFEVEGDNGVAGVSGGKGEEGNVCGSGLLLNSGNMGGRDDCGGGFSEVWLKKRKCVFMKNNISTSKKLLSGEIINAICFLIRRISNKNTSTSSW